MCPSQEDFWTCLSQRDFGCGVTGLREDGYVCYKLQQGVLLCTGLSPNNEVCENLTEVGRGFSPQLG